ncbi:MAG: tripartite tricarboxylate transporter permease [Candidatus Micrarchaeota archaeon]
MALWFFIAGIILGMLGGLLPGIHSNTIISILSSVGLSGIDFAYVIIAVMASHQLFSFIPSIFFGIPEQGSVLSVLPGQRMVREGNGTLALKVVLASFLIGVLLSVVLFYPALSFYPLAYKFIQPYIKYILVIFSAILLLRTKNLVLSAGIFTLSGLLGVFSLNAGLADPFLPLFSGMFAMGAIFSYAHGSVPRQKDAPLSLDFLKFAVLGVFGGLLADLLPGVSSPSQVATFFSLIMPVNTLGYLAAISSISVSEAVFSFATSASIGKARMGSTVFLSEHIALADNLLLVLAVFLFSIAVAALFIYLLRNRISALAKIDFSHFNLLLAGYLVAMTFILNGLAGIVILGFASCLGYATIRLGVERTNLMGAVIIPTILLLFRVFLK